MAVREIDLIGAAIGWGAQNHETQNAPGILKKKYLDGKWKTIVEPPISFGENHLQMNYTERVLQVSEFNKSLCEAVRQTLGEGRLPVVIGGDHSCAIGTWNGAAADLIGDLGLIWIDAHMDAHTFETTPSQAIHGMPVAVLLGYGDKKLLGVGKSVPVIKPENLAYIGVRSFEEGEAILLRNLNVKIFLMQEVKQRGFAQVFQDAVKHVSKNTTAYGISFDLDGFDPDVAPGVGSPANDGITNVIEVCKALGGVANDPKLCGFEIAELNIERDENGKTVRIVEELINAFE